MAPLLQNTTLSPKITNVLELLQLIDELEAKLEHLKGMAVPHVNQDLLQAFEIENPDPNPGRSPDPVAQVAGKDLSQMTLDFETGADRYLKKVKEALMFEYRLLLKALLVSGGVKSIALKIPHCEMDEKVLQADGMSLIDDDSEEEEKEKEKEEVKKKKKPTVVSQFNEEPEPKKPRVSNEEPVSVAEWLRARGFVIGKHATSCLDRTLGFGTELLFTRGLQKVTGGTIGECFLVF